MYKPVMLVVLDGWGLGKTDRGNAIAHAQKPTIDKLNAYYPHVALQASGISVGLPWGEVGNSEVGHITLGAGKIIYQSMPRISMEIQGGEFFHNPELLRAVENVKRQESALHLMGLVGKGSVHSYSDHIYALLELAKQQQLQNVYLHIFTDGRDSSPTSGVESLLELQKKMKLYQVGKIATICGRYYAMDRNNNWDRTEKAYNLMTQGKGKQITDPVQYLQDSYKNEIFDEYIEPAVIAPEGTSLPIIQEKDSVIFFNFREDRARQLTRAFVSTKFSEFERAQLKNLYFVTMIQYEEGLPVGVAYPPIGMKDSLGSILAEHNVSQIRIAETEKFAHVTYFFNGGNEETNQGEERIIIPSKAAENYAQLPEMSAQEITDKTIETVNSDKYDFILVNYANADIVGHTGNEEATTKAVETIDRCLSQLIPAVLQKNGCLLITADHGNAEELKSAMTGKLDTEHSLNPVPLWFITPENHSSAPRGDTDEKNVEAEGLLSDVAPTILELMGIEKSEEMTGESLLPLLQ